MIGEETGKASALKMCYAAYTKGATALLTSILALAETSGVRTELSMQWERGEPGFSGQAERRARGVTVKAWRFAGEMDEITSTFESTGLPGGFHAAAGKVYRRLAGFREEVMALDLKDVISALFEKREQVTNTVKSCLPTQ